MARIALLMAAQSELPTLRARLLKGMEEGGDPFIVPEVPELQKVSNFIPCRSCSPQPIADVAVKIPILPCGALWDPTTGVPPMLLRQPIS